MDQMLFNYSKRVSLILLSLSIMTSFQQETALSQNQFAQEILAAHNRYRAAVNVPPLTWSNSLAKDAQKWANHLASLGGNTLQHSSNLGNQGENLWLGTSKRFSYGQMVEGWGQEKQYFRPGRFSLNTVSTTGKWSDVGHYTQMVWRKTTQVGCALASAGGNDILVCRYAPRGNVVNQPVY
jgi:uncharacterized protein YkwD